MFCMVNKSKTSNRAFGSSFYPSRGTLRTKMSIFATMNFFCWDLSPDLYDIFGGSLSIISRFGKVLSIPQRQTDSLNPEK